MRFLTARALPTGRADGRGGGGGQNERVPCSQTQGGPWDLAVHPSLGQFSPALFHGEKERFNRNCSTDSRSQFNSQMPYDILPQNATTESRDVRVLDTLHLTRPAEIQNSLALARYSVQAKRDFAAAEEQ